MAETPAVVTEVSKDKDWLKPDQSKKEEKLTREGPQSSLYHLYMETDTTSRKGTERVNHDTFRMDYIRDKAPPTRRQSQNLTPQRSETAHPWKHIKSQ